MIIKIDSTLLIMIMNIIIIMGITISKEENPTPPLEDDRVKIQQNSDPPEDDWVNIEGDSFKVVSVNENGTPPIADLFLVNSNNNIIPDMIQDPLKKLPIDELSRDELSEDDQLGNEFEKSRKKRVAMILMEDYPLANCDGFFSSSINQRCERPGCGAYITCHPANHNFEGNGLICGMPYCGKPKHLHPSENHK